MLREILDDEKLNDYVKKETGKHLAIIDAGAQITIPAAKITFTGSSITFSDNTKQEANYNIAFILPFWGADALRKSHEFLDVATLAFFEHEQRDNPIKVNRVIRLRPSIIEQGEESEVWTVALDATVSIFF